MAGLMRSRASPRGYLLVHPSEDRTIKTIEPLRIEFTATTSITGIKCRQAIQEMSLENQLVLNGTLGMMPPSFPCLAIIPHNKRLQVQRTIEAIRGHLSLRLGQESTNLHSVTTPFLEIDLNDTPISKISLHLC
jgi:hypothetical protein